jgi:hypothetical protein
VSGEAWVALKISPWGSVTLMHPVGRWPIFMGSGALSEGHDDSFGETTRGDPNTFPVIRFSSVSRGVGFVRGNHPGARGGPGLAGFPVILGVANFPGSEFARILPRVPSASFRTATPGHPPVARSSPVMSAAGPGCDGRARSCWVRLGKSGPRFECESHKLIYNKILCRSKRTGAVGDTASDWPGKAGWSDNRAWCPAGIARDIVRTRHSPRGSHLQGRRVGPDRLPAPGQPRVGPGSSEGTGIRDDL